MEAARSPLPALGALLIRDGAITPEQLEDALAEKRVTPEKRLGEILVERGYATRTQVTRVLAEQHELEFIELDFPAIEVEAAMLLPENLARRYLALPIHFLEDGSVMVAVADPTNVMFSDELRLALGVPVRVCVAAADAIESAINRIHAEATVDIEEVVTDAAETEDDAHGARPRARHARGRVHQPRHLEGARLRRLGHPLHAAAATRVRRASASTASCAS